MTKRERECLLLAAQGHSSKVIGRTLGISPTTVKAHLGGAMRHFGVSNRIQASMRALEAKCFSLRDVLKAGAD